LLVAALWLAPAWAGEPLDALMARLAEVREAKARFVEEKTVSFLQVPLITRGALDYRAPDYLRKEVDPPNSQSFEIRGDDLLIRGPDGRHTMKLGDHPLLQAFVESLRATLAGDAASLRRHYRIEVDGNLDQWTLRLLPRNRDMARHVAHIDIHGQGAQLFRVDILEHSGDFTSTRILAGE
jgi:hypothetical protein